MKTVQREISLVVKETGKRHARPYTYNEPESLAEARQVWGDDGVFKLAIQADQTNHDNANRGALRREVVGGVSKIDRITSLIASLTAEQRQEMLTKVGIV